MAFIQPLGRNLAKLICTGTPVNANIPLSPNAPIFLEVDDKALDMVAELFPKIAARADALTSEPDFVRFFRERSQEHLIELYAHANILAGSLFKHFHGSSAHVEADRFALYRQNRSTPLSRLMEGRLCMCVEMAVLAMAYFERHPVGIGDTPATVKLMLGDVLPSRIPYGPHGIKGTVAHGLNLIEIPGDTTYVFDPMRSFPHEQGVEPNISMARTDDVTNGLLGIQTHNRDGAGYFPSTNLLRDYQEIYGFTDNSSAAYPVASIAGNPKLRFKYDLALYRADDPHAPDAAERQRMADRIREEDDALQRELA